MAITVAQVEVSLDGDTCRFRWTIPAQAHAVGLSAARGGGHLYMGDDLGSPEGAGPLKAALYHASDAILHRVLRAWDDTYNLF